MSKQDDQVLKWSRYIFKYPRWDWDKDFLARWENKFPYSSILLAGLFISRAGYIYTGQNLVSGLVMGPGASDTRSSESDKNRRSDRKLVDKKLSFIICSDILYRRMTKLWMCWMCQFPPARSGLIFHELKWPIVLSNINFIVVLMTDIGRLWLGIRILSHNPLHHNVILQQRDWLNIFISNIINILDCAQDRRWGEGSYFDKWKIVTSHWF